MLIIAIARNGLFLDTQFELQADPGVPKMADGEGKDRPGHGHLEEDRRVQQDSDATCRWC